MCTVRIKVNEEALRRYDPALADAAAIRKWAQELVDSHIDALAQEREAKEQDFFNYEKWDITKTNGYREAMDDVVNGRVTSYDSVDAFFAEMKAEVEADAQIQNN